MGDGACGLSPLLDAVLAAAAISVVLEAFSSQTRRSIVNLQKSQSDHPPTNQNLPNDNLLSSLKFLTFNFPLAQHVRFHSAGLRPRSSDTSL